jgi:hypothetical protein
VEDLKLKGVEFQVGFQYLARFTKPDSRIDIRQYPLCRIPPHASPVELVPEQNRQTSDLPSNLYGDLGCDFRSHSRMP